MVQFQNEYINIELVNNSTAILLTWKGFVPSSGYREALDKALEIAKKHRIENWISDIRLMRVLSLQDQEWVTKEWAVGAVGAACYKKQAVIMPEGVITKFAIDKIITKLKDLNIEMQNFENVEEAKNWLTNEEQK